MNHDALCAGSCCEWLHEPCGCQCDCDLIAKVRADERRSPATEEPTAEYMCPFCVTPWKCNGPHIDEQDLANYESASAETYESGQRDMLAKCIAALEADDMHSEDPSWDGTNWNNAVYECIEILRALQEKP